MINSYHNHSQGAKRKDNPWQGVHLNADSSTSQWQANWWCFHSELYPCKSLYVIHSFLIPSYKNAPPWPDKSPKHFQKHHISFHVLWVPSESFPRHPNWPNTHTIHLIYEHHRFILVLSLLRIRTSCMTVFNNETLLDASVLVLITELRISSTNNWRLLNTIWWVIHF